MNQEETEILSPNFGSQNTGTCQFLSTATDLISYTLFYLNTLFCAYNFIITRIAILKIRLS